MPRFVVHFLIRTGLVVIGFVLVSAQAADHVRVYPAPAGEPLSKLFSVTVANQPSPVYVAAVGSLTGPNLKEELMGQASFTSFDMAGPVEVSVTYAQPVREVKLLPSRSGITPVFTANRVTFVVSKPGQLTLEVNGDWNNSLHLFANPFETSVPNPKDPNVIYFGPGIHQLRRMEVRSGTTVYIAGGAVLYGPNESMGVLIKLVGSNITIRGRGIIDGSALPKISHEVDGITHLGGTKMIWARGSGTQVEGIILRDSGGQTLHINESENVSITNIKVFGWRLNSDGINIDGSQNVVVSNSFFRTYDDLVAVKAGSETGKVANITVKGCVLWNEKAHALTLGRVLKDNVNGVLFTDSDIIHDKGNDALLAIHDDARGGVRNITFDNLRVEESARLVWLSIRAPKENEDATRGHIDGVTFRNITAPIPWGKGSNINLEGYSSSSEIDNVIFDGVTIGAAKLQPGDVKSNEFVGRVAVSP